MTDVRTTLPACPEKTCGASAGDRNCYTDTGFPRTLHAVRRALLNGEEPTVKPAGSLAGQRPTKAQARLLAAAAANNDRTIGVSGYNFAGDAQRRATMKAMVDEVRGWFVHVGADAHSEHYQMTGSGAAALKRYRSWMYGES